MATFEQAATTRQEVIGAIVGLAGAAPQETGSRVPQLKSLLAEPPVPGASDVGKAERRRSRTSSVHLRTPHLPSKASLGSSDEVERDSVSPVESSDCDVLNSFYGPISRQS